MQIKAAVLNQRQAGNRTVSKQLTYLENYAFILRKNYKGQQARGIEARIAAIGIVHGGPGTVVDASELAAAKALHR